jgi:hypothetical protein
MRELSRRRRTVTSSLNEIFTDQLGNRVVVGGGGALLRPPPPLSIAGFSRRIFKDDVNGFFSTPDICLMIQPKGTNYYCKIESDLTGMKYEKQGNKSLLPLMLFMNSTFS